MIGSASAELFRNYFDIRLSGVSIPLPECMDLAYSN